MAQVTFSDWTERFKVYNKYIKAVAEYKLKSAQAEAELAEAANDWALYRSKQIVMRQLERELRQYNRAQMRNQRELRQLQERDKAARLLLRGNRIQLGEFRRGWSAYVFFEAQAMVLAEDELHAISVPRSARGERNFIAIRTSDSVIPAPPLETENALQLIDWLNNNLFIARRGSDAQRSLAQLYREINAVATREVEDIRERMQQLEDGTYEAWDFNAILGVSDNAAAMRIQGSGTHTA